MPSYVFPKKNTEFIFSVGLISQANSNILQVAPTLAGGDVKVSIDNGTLNNLTTLPVVTPPASKIVKVTLSAAEMNGDNISVVFSDAAGAEWADQHILIQTTARQVDDLAYPTYQLTDSVPADGTIPTLAQSLYMITQFLNERSVVGSTVTVKKVDGASTLMTFTLNDPTNPTSITRTT
jgi:hypothetical protein